MCLEGLSPRDSDQIFADGGFKSDMEVTVLYMGAKVQVLGGCLGVLYPIAS